MQIENMKSFVAGSFIGRSRFVRMSDEFKVIECDGTNVSVRPVGLAQNWGNKAPGTPFEVSTGLAASSGDTLMVYTDGADDAPAQCGGSVTAGDALGIAANGLVVTSAANNTSFHWLAGYAKESGTTGDVIRIRVAIAPIALS
jgi:hypothetical protein